MVREHVEKNGPVDDFKLFVSIAEINGVLKKSVQQYTSRYDGTEDIIDALVASSSYPLVSGKLVTRINKQIVDQKFEVSPRTKWYYIEFFKITLLHFMYN